MERDSPGGQKKSIKILFKSEKGLLRIIKTENNVIKLQQIDNSFKEKYIDVCETPFEEIFQYWVKEYRLKPY